MPGAQNVRLLFETAWGLKLLYCGRYICSPDWSTKDARVMSNMIGFFFVEKNLCYSRINRGPERILKEGDLQVACSGDVVDVRHDPARPLVVLSFCVAWRQGDIPNILLQRQLKQQYSLEHPVEYIHLFDTLLQSLAGSPLAVKELMVGGALLRLIGHLLLETRAPLRKQSLSGETRVNKILAAQAWAKEHLNAVITLDNWARTTGWHPVYFEQMFKQQTGIAPIRWLEANRMEAARQYLCVSGQSVAEIAEAVGYGDPFYFSRLFRKHFEMSPSQYRKAASLTPEYANPKPVSRRP